MSEGIVPFVSLSPPPFDDEDFKFDDGEDLFGRGSDGYLVEEGLVQESEYVRKELNNISSNSINLYSMTITKENNEFDDFLDYHTVVTDSKIEDNEIKVEETSGDFKGSEINCEDQILTKLNRFDDEEMNEEVDHDDFDDFEEFVFRESKAQFEDTNTTEEIDFSMKLKVDCDGSIKYHPDFQVDVKTFDENQVDTNNLNFCNQYQIKAYGNDDKDDFCGFEGVVEIDQSTNKMSDNFEDESWACFEIFEGTHISEEQNTLSKTNLKHPNDDDFGGFEEAMEDDEPKITEIPLSTCEILNQTFNIKPLKIDCNVATLLDLIGANKGNSSSEENGMCSRIWKSLESIERTPALKMQWKSSSLLQLLLATINIPQQTKASSHSNVPAFASNLGLLEPTRLREGHSEVKDYTNAPLNDIPNVEFDWANSVLTDPLDVGNLCHLDLDFFGDEVFSSCMSPACKKERELLDSLEPSCSHDPRKSLSIDSFLANVPSKSVTLIKNPSSDHSVPPRLKVILDKIPDLSFMQSKVLTFPMREEFIGTAETFS